MSLSAIDVSQLEIVKTFSGFLQIMQEPDKYKDLLKETDRLIAEKRRLLGPCQTKEAADRYLADAQAKIDARVQEDKKKQEAFVTYQEDKKAELEAMKDKANEVMKSVLEKDALVESNLKEAQAMKIAAKEAMLKEESKLKATELLLASNAEKQRELDQKLEKVTKMLGV